jgi:preprotein translocase subunit SecG
MLYYLLTSLYVFVCMVLLMVILLQQGKGGDMASAFGGGSSQTAFGARGGATLLTKMTTVFAVLFMLGALALAIIGQRGPGSIVGGTAAPPAAPASSAPQVPATPAAQKPASAPAQQPPAPAQSPATPK